MTISSAGSLQRPRRTDGGAIISIDGWFAYAWRNPGGTEPGDAATASATQWVRWGGGTNDRLIAIGGGKQTGNNAFKEIRMPLDGVTIPVSDGTVRTVVAAGTTISTDYGGIALATWDTLWVKLDWNAGTTQANEFFIVRGAQTADDTSQLPQADPNIEWVMVVSCRANATVMLWNGDTLKRGQEIGQCGSLAAQVNNDRKAFDDMQLRGCQFLTQSQAIGLTGSLVFRGVAGGGSVWGENTAADVAAPVAGTSVRLIGGTGGGTDVLFRAPVAADQMELFGGQSVGGQYGNFKTSAVLDRPAAGTYVGTLHVHRRQGNSARVGGVVPAVTSWFMHADGTGAPALPSSWVPIVSIGSVLSGGDGLYIHRTGTILGRNDTAMHGVRDHEANIARSVTYTVSPPHARWTDATFIQPGAVPNGSTRFTVAERGLLIGWDDGTLALGYGSATSELLGQPSTAANVPAVGYNIPVAGMPGATRVVQALANTTRRYIPLARDEILIYRPALGGAYNDAGWLVIPVGAALVGLSSSVVVAHTRGTSDIDNAAAVYFMNGLVQVSPGTYLPAGVTPTYGDCADGHSVWMPAVLAGQTPPGGTGAIPAVANLTGAYPGVVPEYIIMRDPSTMRKVCRVRGALQVAGNIADDSTLLHLPGAWARNSSRIPITVIGSGSANKPRTASVYPANGAPLGGMNGLRIAVKGASLATNPGLTGGDATWGAPTELWFDFTVDMA